MTDIKNCAMQREIDDLKRQNDELYESLHGTALDLQQTQQFLARANVKVMHLEAERDEIVKSLHGTALDLQETTLKLQRMRELFANMEEDRNYFRESNSIFEAKLHNIGAIVDSYFHESTNPRLKLMAIRDILD